MQDRSDTEIVTVVHQETILWTTSLLASSFRCVRLCFRFKAHETTRVLTKDSRPCEVRGPHACVQKARDHAISSPIRQIVNSIIQRRARVWCARLALDQVLRTCQRTSKMAESKFSSMLANLTKFGQSAAQKAAERAAMIAESVTAQSRTALDYEIGAEVGAAGPEGVWKIHRARPVKTGAGMCCGFMAARPCIGGESVGNRWASFAHKLVLPTGTRDVSGQNASLI